MASPWQQYINTEIQKRIGVVSVPVTGNATQNTIPRFTGTGLTVEESWPVPFENSFIVAKSGAQFDTIQAAIDAVPDWVFSLIVVYPGRYEENLVITNKLITITGTSPDKYSNTTTIFARSGNLLSSGEGNTYSFIRVCNCDVSAGDADNISNPLVGDTSIYYSKCTTTDMFDLTFFDVSLEINNTVSSAFKAYIKTVDPVSNISDLTIDSCYVYIIDAYEGAEEIVYINAPNANDVAFRMENCEIYMNITYLSAIRTLGCSYGGNHGNELINVYFNNNVFSMSFATNSSQVIKMIKCIGLQNQVQINNNQIYLNAYDNAMNSSARIYTVSFESTGLTVLGAALNVVSAHPTRVAPYAYFIKAQTTQASIIYNMTYNYLGGIHQIDGILGTFNYVGQPVDLIRSAIDYNLSASAGGSDAVARADHIHGTPRNRIVYALQAPTNPVEGDLWIQS